MIYNCYGQYEKPSLLIEAGRADLPKMLEEGDILLWSYNVEDWIDACILMNEDAGYLPYRPHDDDREEYLKALKRLGRNPRDINDQREKEGLERLDWLEE